MFMGVFLLFYVETAIIYLNDVKQTVCILGTQCLWREKGSEVLNLIWTELRLQVVLILITSFCFSLSCF